MENMTSKCSFFVCQFSKLIFQTKKGDKKMIAT